MIRKFTKALEVKKAFGPDDVPPRVLRECAAVRQYWFTFSVAV